MYDYNEITVEKLQHRFDKFDDLSFVCNGDLLAVFEESEDEE